MIWKSLREDWPYQHDEVWLRWTEDGVTYHEKIVTSQSLDNFKSLDVPEWRELEPPAWMSSQQQEDFRLTQGPWIKKVLESDED